MDGEKNSRGYGSSSGRPEKNIGFDSDFISFGSNESSEDSHPQWRPRGGRRGPPQLISGTRDRKPYQDGSSRGGWKNRNSNDWSSNQPYHDGFSRGGWNNQAPNHWGPNHGARSQRGWNNCGPNQRPFRRGGFDHQRDNKHQRSHNPRSSGDISTYFHPSMIEDPWYELENLLKIPQSNEASSSSQCESSKNLDSENFGEDQNSYHSEDSNDS